MATARNPVEAPLAAAPRFGLLASIVPEKTAEKVWKAGIAYRPEGCVEGSIFDPCEAPERTDPDSPDIVEWNPYIITISDKCSSFSGEWDEYEARVRRRMGMATETLIGNEFWNGTLAQASTDTDGNDWPNTWLANVADVDILTESGAVGLVHGLACLEQYLAENNGGQQGAIHATPQTVTHWESFRLLRREGNRILTFKDTVVIPSPGYTGDDPNGNVADNNVWAYATDMPRIYLGEINVTDARQTSDWRDNTMVSVAQRRAMVEFEKCRHGGVRLAMTLCDSGGS